MVQRGILRVQTHTHKRLYLTLIIFNLFLISIFFHLKKKSTLNGWKWPKTTFPHLLCVFNALTYKFRRVWFIVKTDIPKSRINYSITDQSSSHSLFLGARSLQACSTSSFGKWLYDTYWLKWKTKRKVFKITIELQQANRGNRAIHQPTGTAR